jgi:hypothetical protein
MFSHPLAMTYRDLGYPADDPHFNCKECYTPIIPSVALEDVFDFLHTRAIPYVFITGRAEYLRSHTKRNLGLCGLNGYKRLYMMPNHGHGSANASPDNVAAFKERCRARLAEEYTVRLTVGDQRTDLSGAHTGIPLLIFNPFY